MNSTTTVKLAAPLLALGLAMTACSGTDANTDNGREAASADHNEQDVAFATEMIPHHAQAVEMAQMAADNAESPEVKALAENISAAQGPEIEQMSSWLDAWGEDVPNTDAEMGDMDGMDHGGSAGMQDMPGMMTADEMADLDAASGAAFDEKFLSMMIEHHEGAIEMARTEQVEGEYPEALDLGETIEKAQTAEIETMKDLLDS